MGLDDFPREELEWDPSQVLYCYESGKGTRAYVVRDDALHLLPDLVQKPEFLTPVSLADYLVPEEDEPLVTFAEADEMGLRLPKWTMKGTTSRITQLELLRRDNEAHHLSDPDAVLEEQLYEFGVPGKDRATLFSYD